MPWTYLVIRQKMETGMFPQLADKFKILKKKRAFMKAYLISLIISVVTLGCTLLLSDMLDTIAFIATIKHWLQGTVITKAVFTLGTLFFLFWKASIHCRFLREEIEDGIYKINLRCR